MEKKQVQVQTQEPEQLQEQDRTLIWALRLRAFLFLLIPSFIICLVIITKTKMTSQATGITMFFAFLALDFLLSIILLKPIMKLWQIISIVGNKRIKIGNTDVSVKKILILIIIAIVIILFIVALKNDKKSNDTDSYNHDQYDAIVIAERTVKSKLKSPSTAKFSSYSVTRNGNTWRVSGYVDAQNSFGATIRNSFTVSITFSSKDKYTINSCSIT